MGYARRNPEGLPAAVAASEEAARDAVRALSRQASGCTLWLQSGPIPYSSPGEAEEDLEKNSFPADDFSAQRPCFRATSLIGSRKRIQKMKVGKRQISLDKFLSNRITSAIEAGIEIGVRKLGRFQ
jgi:hypothetical protein